MSIYACVLLPEFAKEGVANLVHEVPRGVKQNFVIGWSPRRSEEIKDQPEQTMVSLDGLAHDSREGPLPESEKEGVPILVHEVPRGVMQSLQ